MIRPFTLLCFGAFATAGAWLYQVKHQVAMKDRELVEIRRQTEQARQRLDILRAEWALLNEPDRLRKTATRVLSLEPMQPQHFARAADLDRRLPAAMTFAGAPDLFAPPPATEPQRPPVMLASTAPATAGRGAVAAATTPARAAAPAATTAPMPNERIPEAPAPQALAAALAAQRAEQAARPAPRPAPQATPQPSPRPVQPAVHVAPTPPPPAPVTRVTLIAPPAAPPATVASALGGTSSLGRPTLAPPVPVGTAAAAALGTPPPR
jgi:hypothetical protein